MNEQNKLIISRSIFIFFTVIIFGFIIISEKGGELFLPKAKQKMNLYLEEKYNTKIGNWLIEEPTYKKRTFTEKIISKDNNNLFFYIKYKDKKITDTYKKDYLEGESLIKYLKKNLKKEIFKKTKINSTIIIPLKLNEYTSKVSNQIIKEENLLELKFYQIQIELQIKDWQEKKITAQIINILNIFKSNKIYPKSFTIIITNENDITESIEISNLTEDFLTNNSKEEIISAIIKKNNKSMLNDNNIDVKYLN